MTGNVVIDDVETEAPPPPRLAVIGILGLSAAVILTLVVLPGLADEEVPPSSSTTPRLEEEDRWSPIDLPGPGPLQAVTRLVDGSYVAVGDGPQAWRYDGEGTWEWVLRAEDAQGALFSVTPYSQGAASWWSVAGGVAVGLEHVNGSLTEAAIWKSDDSTTWRQVSLDVGHPSGLEGVLTIGRRLLAWGWRGSARYSSPETDALVMESVDGENWAEVDMGAAGPSSFRVLSVANRMDTWYLAGVESDRPSLWRSGSDLDSWTPVDTDDLPRGWAMADLRWGAVNPARQVELIATLTHLDDGGARRWAHDGDGWRAIDEGSGDLVSPVHTDDGTIGVGDESLWIREEGDWEALDLVGEVSSVAEGVAVGANPDGRPRVWVLDGDGEEQVRVSTGADGRWRVERELGEGNLAGAWKVGDGWVLGGSPDRWWFIDGDGVRSFRPPWGRAILTIAPVGDEWVALPSMHWSSDGVNWEHRADPWPRGQSPPEVYALAELEGRILAVGRDLDHVWKVAESNDGGRSWSLLDEAGAMDPVWSVTGTPHGFVGISAGNRALSKVVVSEDGRKWESLAPRAVLLPTQPPAVVTEGGGLVLMDTGEELQPPRIEITALARTEDGLVVVAGGSMWEQRAEGWEEIPLDPTIGMTASRVRPVPLGDRILAAGVDRGRRLLYEWES